MAEKIYPTRRLKTHETYSKEFDGVSSNIKKERRKYIPPQSHPWKLESFKRYLQSIDRTIEEYETEKTAWNKKYLILPIMVTLVQVLRSKDCANVSPHFGTFLCSIDSE